MNSHQRESLTARVRPFEYMVLNAWTDKVLFRNRNLDPAEDFYEAEIERNQTEEIQLVAVLRYTGSKP